MILTNTSTRMITADPAPAVVTWTAPMPCGCPGRWTQTYGQLPTCEAEGPCVCRRSETEER